MATLIRLDSLTEPSFVPLWFANCATLTDFFIHRLMDKYNNTLIPVVCKKDPLRLSLIEAFRIEVKRQCLRNFMPI